MYIKIALVIILLVGGYFGYRYFTKDDRQIEISNEIVVDIEKKNKELTIKLDEVLKESAILKEQVAQNEQTRIELYNEIQNTKASVRNIREREALSKNKYVEKVNSISNDTTDIYSRCKRMCESAENIKIGCAVNFCEQFSVSNSAK